jgi:hypothetical protein
MAAARHRAAFGDVDVKGGIRCNAARWPSSLSDRKAELLPLTERVERLLHPDTGHWAITMLSGCIGVVSPSSQAHEADVHERDAARRPPTAA